MVITNITSTSGSGSSTSENSDGGNNNINPVNEPIATIDIKKKILKFKLNSSADRQHIRQLAEKLLYSTSFTSGSTNDKSSLADYVDRMKPGQNTLYYIIGRSLKQISCSPHARRVIQAGLEVIYMTDPLLDAQVVDKLGGRYGENQLPMVSVVSEDLELPLVDNKTSVQRYKRHLEALNEHLPLCKRIKSVFAGHQPSIQKIVISNTLVNSSFVLVLRDQEDDLHVDGNEEEPYYPIDMQHGRITLEINPENDSLKLLCLQARVLEKKQNYLDATIRALFGPPNGNEDVNEDRSQEGSAILEESVSQWISSDVSCSSESD